MKVSNQVLTKSSFLDSELALKRRCEIILGKIYAFENQNYRQLDSRVFVFDRATQQSTDLSSGKANGTLDYDCKFSPNEAQVIFTNTSNDQISQRNIYLIDVNSSGDAENRTLVFQNADMPDYE